MPSIARDHATVSQGRFIYDVRGNRLIAAVATKLLTKKRMRRGGNSADSFNNLNLTVTSERIRRPQIDKADGSP